MAKKKYKNKDIQAQAKEPQTNYGSDGANNTIRFFSSFEEMNEADAAEVAKFTPEQHLQHVTEMILTVYTEELKKPLSDLKIYFK